MRPFTLIIAMSATILALPKPLPAAVDDASGAILGALNSGLNGVVGSPDPEYKGGKGGYGSGCHYRHKEDIASCINTCVAQCVVDSEGCNTCIRGCSSRHGCESHHDGKNHHHHHHDRPDRRDDEADDENSE
ncbi:hypothetical protein F4805DRAFT_459449 [Annulohypoxylon moriforme]|nr:hypothetical protein F4805DRAFT_459449 [Annulohypoxylon moriforme]